MSPKFIRPGSKQVSPTASGFQDRANSDLRCCPHITKVAQGLRPNSLKFVTLSTFLVQDESVSWKKGRWTVVEEKTHFLWQLLHAEDGGSASSKAFLSVFKRI
jgi:hypothetical protein